MGRMAPSLEMVGSEHAHGASTGEWKECAHIFQREAGSRNRRRMAVPSTESIVLARSLLFRFGTLLY